MLIPGSSALKTPGVRVRRRSPLVSACLLAVAAGLAFTGCSTAAGVASEVTVTQTRTPPPAVTVQKPSAEITVPTTDPSTAEGSPADPATPDEVTTDPSTTTTTTSSGGSSSTPGSSTGTTGSKTTGSSTGTASTFDPLSLPDDQPADPDTPGPDNGKKCATNDAYVDEDPTGLEPNLILAWRAVEKAANADGVVVCLNDGKRSRAQQQATFDEYVAQYGEEVAKQYVLPPDKSAHVIGNAIDVQPAAAFNWLMKTDGAFGLCRIYDNELWHFEFKKSYASTGCPALLPNPLG